MSIGRASRALAAAAAAIVVAVVVGCDSLPDEQLLRFLGFHEPGGTDTISVVRGDLFEISTEFVDAELQNATFTVGRNDDPGVGILVNKARVEYSLKGAPSYEYPVTLYLPAPESKGATTQETINGLPLVPEALKQWIEGSGVQIHPSVRFTATVTFFARTDDGNDLEVEGSIAVELNDDGGGGGGGGGEKPSVSIEATTPIADQSSQSFGIFTITRLGDTTSDLTVTYALSGDAKTINYTLSPSTIFIPADDPDTTVTVRPTTSPVLTAPVELTVTLTATTTSNYIIVGLPATVTIQP